MELNATEDFQLSGFSPCQLSFFPSLNCILATDRQGNTRCIDTVTKVELSPPGKEFMRILNTKLLRHLHEHVHLVLTTKHKSVH